MEQKERTENRSYKKIILYVFLALLSVTCSGIVFLSRNLLRQPSVESFDAVSYIEFTPDGGKLVIDDGNKTLFLVDSSGTIVRRYNGGDMSGAFFYACHAVAAPDGSIYVADIAYGSRGALLERERIIKLTGRERLVVYEDDYTELPEKDIPLQKGRILELQEYGGQIYFTKISGNTLIVSRFNEQDEVETVGKALIAGRLSDVSYDVANNMLVASTRSGLLLSVSLQNGIVRNLGGGARQPMDISAQDGQVYYVDPYNKTVWHKDLMSPKDSEVFFRFDSIPRKLAISEDGRNLLVSDGENFYQMGIDDEGQCRGVEQITSAKISFFYRVILTWAVLVVAVGIFAFFAYKLLLKILFLIIYNETALRVCLIMLAAIGVSFVLAYSLLSQILDGNLDATEEKAHLFAEILMSKVDVDTLLSIQQPEDADSKAFADMKAALDAHIWASYVSKDYYYYLIYRANGDVISSIMDFEDVHPSWEPIYEYGDNVYTQTLETGAEISESEISSYGSWSFVLMPITDAMGNIVAELEVGVSLDELQRSQNTMRRELLINVVISSIVVTMLLLELTFLLRFLENRSQEGRKDPTEQVPVRTLIFLSYVTDSMQDVFIAVLLSELYDGFLPISDSLAIALPMSLQLFAMAVFSLIGGRLTEHYGVRVGLSTGFGMQMAGFLTCFLTGNFLGIMIGKLLIGAGMGIVYVSGNTVASLGMDEEHTEKAFADVSAGILSGITIGAGLSSVLLSMGGYRLIYLSGAIMLTMALGLVWLYSPSGLAYAVHPEESEEEENAVEKIGVFRFLTSRRIAGFFLFLLLPFMMALAYREYLFPLYATEQNFSETRIGQIYLLCGLMGLYIGPPLSAWILKSLGPKRAIIMASGLMLANLTVFVLHPSLPSVIFGVMLLSFIISFAYTCQYSYFDTLDEIREYGSGAAMGIYSMLESLGQTLGPMLYGVLFTFGYRKGIGAFAVLMLVTLLLFIALSGKRKAKAVKEV